MVPLCISAFRSKVWTVCLNFDFGHVWQWKGQTNNRCSEDSMTLLPNVFFVWVSDRWQIAQSPSSVFWGQRWQVWKLQRSSWKVSCHKAGLSVRLCILQHPCVFLLVLLGLRCRSKERKKHSSTSQRCHNKLKQSLSTATKSVHQRCNHEVVHDSWV